MVLKKNRCFFYLMILMLFPLFIGGQILNAQKWDDNEWDEVTKDLNYGDTKEEVAKKQKKVSFIDNSDMNVLTPIKYILISMLIILAIIGVVYFIKYNIKKGSNLQKLDINSVTIEQIEENLKQIDLLSLINQAKNQKQFKLAVRLCYLEFLKLLDKQKHLKLKINKTNNDYINEVVNITLKTTLIFKTREFEKIWFSKIDEISEEEFNVIYESYKLSLKNIL